MIEQVVVGWDGSRAAACATEWAVQRQGGAGVLELARIVDGEHLPPDWDGRTDSVDWASSALDREAERLQIRYPQLHVRAGLRIGTREDELVARSDERTLLVLGTAERIGPRLRFHFSLAVRLAARSTGPVAVVPFGYRSHPAGPVVVGVDGSTGSIAAARLAAEEAARRGVRLVAVHAWWDTVDRDAMPPLQDGVQKTFEQIHRRLLDVSVDAIADAEPGLDIERRLVHGPHTEALLAAAEDACELVVGKHVRARARELLIGTASRNVLLDTWVPTVVGGAAGDVEPATAPGAAIAAQVGRS